MIITHSSRPNNLVLRSVTGLALIAFITGVIFAGPLVFLLFVLILNLLALHEFYKLVQSEIIHPLKGMATMLSLVVTIICLLVFLHADWRLIFISVPFIAGVFYAELFRKSAHPFSNISVTLLGIVYITLPLLLFACTAFLPTIDLSYHPYTLLAYFIMLWVFDSASYAAGNLAGKHKLFLRVSPGKTWEGFAGGALAVMVVTYPLTFLNTGIPQKHLLVISLIIIVTGTLGDLTKSLLKRSVGVKDSGTFLPGHGGVLDRFDSLMGSAPFVFCYLLLLNLPY